MQVGGGRRTALAAGAAGAVLLVAGVLVGVGAGDGSDEGGVDCLGPQARARWALPLGESGPYGDDGLVDATRVGGTVVIRTVATGADGSDVQGESTGGALSGVRGGEVVWSREGLDLVGPLRGDDGLLAADDGDLLRLDAEGEVVWTVADADLLHQHDDRLVVRTADDDAVVLDAGSGEVERELGGSFVGAAGADVLVTADGDGVALVGLDGDERWVARPERVDVGDGVAALFGDGLVVLGETGPFPTVVGLGRDDGGELWRVRQRVGEGSLTFGGAGPGGTVALREAAADGFVTTVYDESGPIAREPVGVETVSVRGEPAFYDSEDDRLLDRTLGEVLDLDLEGPVGFCRQGLYATPRQPGGDEDDEDGEDGGSGRGGAELEVVDLSTGRVRARVGTGAGASDLVPLDGALLVETEVDGEPYVVLYA